MCDQVHMSNMLECADTILQVVYIQMNETTKLTQCAVLQVWFVDDDIKWLK